MTEKKIQEEDSTTHLRGGWTCPKGIFSTCKHKEWKTFLYIADAIVVFFGGKKETQQNMTQSEKKEENCEGADVSLAMWCGCCCWRAITYRYGSFFFFFCSSWWWGVPHALPAHYQVLFSFSFLPLTSSCPVLFFSSTWKKKFPHIFLYIISLN